MCRCISRIHGLVSAPPPDEVGLNVQRYIANPRFGQCTAALRIRVECAEVVRELKTIRRTILASDLLLNAAKGSDAIGARRSRVQCAVLLSHPTHILLADIDVTATKSAPDEVGCNALQLRLMLHTAQYFCFYGVGGITSARRSRVQCAAEVG